MTQLRFLTAGESHGPGLTIIVEGMPAGLRVSEDDIKAYLQRRQKGFGSGGRMKIENDAAKILSGVRHGITLGSPIAMWIENRDFVNWKTAMAIEEVPADADKRAFANIVPGHADFAGALKYMHHDLRNVLERASARETAARVASGALAVQLLREFDITIRSHVISIGKYSAKSVDVTSVDWEQVEASEVRAHNREADTRFKEEITTAKRNKTTVGGVVQAVAFAPPIGLGSHVHWDRKLDGRIAQALMSINAVKGIEVGDGFSNTHKFGHDVQDVVKPDPTSKSGFKKVTNRAGGIEGGMSNGADIIVNVAIKPIATLAAPLPSVDVNTGTEVAATYNRSDVCQASRACPIIESALAQTLAQAFLEKFGGDSLAEVTRNFKGYVDSHAEFGPPRH